jgi:outer membrane protein assembly factor BamB
VYCISGKGVEATKAVRAGGRGDVSNTHVLWTVKKGTNVPSAVYHEGHIYFSHETKGIAYCLDAETGDTVYEQRVPGLGGVYASAMVGAGKIYYVSRHGGTFVLAAEPNYKLLAHNRLEGDREANASPAVDGQRLILRMGRFLYSIGDPDAALSADMNGDAMVNLLDLAEFAKVWHQTDCGDCSGADLVDDDIVDLRDLAVLASVLTSEEAVLSRSTPDRFAQRWPRSPTLH